MKAYGGKAVYDAFGGSGSELEICKRLKRHYISAEIDEKYYEMIIDRLEKGRVEDKYRMLTEIKAKRKELTQEDFEFVRSQQKNLLRSEEPE